MHRKVLVGAKLQKKHLRIDDTDVALIKGVSHVYWNNEFQHLAKIPLAENPVSLSFLVLSILCLFAQTDKPESFFEID